MDHFTSDDLHPNTPAEDDLWSPARDYYRNPIQLGTVGWDDDDDTTFYEMGTSSDDGHVLVNVQLYRGRGAKQMGNSDDPSVGKGRKIRCHVSSSLFRIPPRGTVCYVALPDGYEDVPAAGVIFATVEKNPFLQFNADRAAMWFGDDKHLVIRAKSITLTDPSNRFIMIGTSRAGGAPSIMCQDETGSGWVVQNGNIGIASADGSPGNPGAIKSLIQVTTTEIDIVQTDGSATKWAGGNWNTGANNAFLNGGGVYLGLAPTAITTALYGTALSSSTVFISP